MTGLRPASHQVRVDRGLGAWPPTLAERFRTAGWSTRAFVTNVQLIPHALGFDRGFERFLAFPGGEGAMLATTAEVNPHLLRELETSHDEPLFLYVHTIDPHAPYDPPACYEGLFGDPAYDGSIGTRDTFAAYLRARTMSPADVARVRDLYDEEVRFQDEMLGTLLDRLAATGLDRETMVVVVADHGEELGDHGDWEHGQRAWEELLHVPLVVRWPGRPDLAGRRVTEPVQIVDLLPTLLASFGLPPAPEAKGRDL
ncbi:MAG: sulfatase, partial [Alphaproteobacteria bacterium]